MPRKNLIFIILFCGMFFIFSGRAQAATWYVDNAVATSGNGTSWNNAWKNFSNIQWASIVPGDTLYISGGATSQTYTDVLRVEASGTVGKPITIKTGQETNHNGTVIITVANNNAITINSQSYITISGKVGAGTDQKMRLTGNFYSGIEIANTADNLLFEYLEIDNNDTEGLDPQNQTGGSVGGINITTSLNPQPTNIEFSNLKVHDNTNDQFHFVANAVYEPSGYDQIKIHDCEIYNQHDDGVESWIGGISFYNNYVHDRIPPYRGHPDMLQLYNTYYKIYNNTFENHYGNIPVDNGGTDGQIMAVYWEPDGGDNDAITWNDRIGNIQIYNNVFSEPNAYQAGTLYVAQLSLAVSDPDFTSVGNVYVYNNTFTGKSTGFALAASFNGSPNHAVVHDFFIENNVFADASLHNSSVGLERGNNADITYGSYGADADVIFDYNAFYGAGSTMVQYGDSDLSSELTYANFVSTSRCQANGVTTDPKLDANLMPMSGSSLINMATTSASSLFLTDKAGVTRGSAWDIGAYEYTTTQACTTKGDFLCDGYGASDIQVMINIILDIEQDSTKIEQAKMNTGDSVDATDLQLLINKVLGIN